MSITVYKQEQLDGLEAKIKASASIAYTTEVKLFTPSTEQEVFFKAVAKSAQRDLYYMAAVLASIGWNSNDDVFDKEETVKAKDSPIDKPFNFMHNETDIIGHMTASVLADAKGNILDKDIPDQFDVVVQSVLYKVWADQKLQERMDKLIAEINDNKWFVSMECLYNGFDYAVILPNNEQKVIARNEQSAFLTKHLKAYGGTGKYQDNKIGRLLRNFAFSGKGLVDNPANKRSVIFTNTDKFSGAKASINIFNKGNVMEEVLKAQLDEAKKTIASLAKDKETYEAKAREDAEKAAKSQVESLTKVVAEKEDALKAKDKTIADLTADKAKVDAAHATEVEKNKVLSTEINSMKAEAVKAARLTKLATAGVTGEDAAKIMEKWASASEEMFDELVTLQAAKKTAEDKNAKKPEQNAKAEEKPVTEDKKGEKAAAEANLETAKVEDKAELNTPVEDKTVALRAAAANWIGNKVLKSTAKLATTTK